MFIDVGPDDDRVELSSWDIVGELNVAIADINWQSTSTHPPLANPRSFYGG